VLFFVVCVCVCVILGEGEWLGSIIQCFSVSWW